jgi:heat shock protein HslJ
MWTLETLTGEAPAPGARFQLKMGVDGRIGGRSGCNDFSARYALNGTAFTVYPPMIGTKMACPEAVMTQEATYRAVLETATAAAVSTDGKLTVTGYDGRTLRFARAGAWESDAAESAATGGVAPPMPVPSHSVMRCGTEQLRVRIAEGQAEVVLDDGSAVMLPRLASEASAAETYTNGRMTLERETSPKHSFRFARGRMALMPCSLAQN